MCVVFINIFMFSSWAVKKFSPHLGQVHLDWHPEKENHLATASGHKDKQICVFDLNEKDEKNEKEEKKDKNDKSSNKKDKTINNEEYTEKTKPKPIMPIMTLSHSEPVSSVQWRPKRATQVTATGNYLSFG